MPGFTTVRGRRRLRACRGGWTLAALVAAICIAPAMAASSPSAVQGVHLLPAGNRVSVVVQLDRTVAATPVSVSDKDAFVVDIGPVQTAAVAAVLRPSTSRLVREVRIDPLTNAAHQSIVRVRVKLQTRAAGSVRVADARVYLDFSPATQPAPPMNAAVASANTPLPAPAEKAPRSGTPQLPGSVDVPTTVLDQARVLANVPDVKALVDLRAKAARRAGDPARLKQELAQIDEYLAEAQRLQLEKDARLFRAHQHEDYLAVLRRAAADLDEIGGMLKSTTLTAGELSGIRAKAVQITSRLHAAPAPSQAGQQHTALCAAADETVSALAAGVTADPRGIASTALASIERTRAAVTAGIAAASDPHSN